MKIGFLNLAADKDWGGGEKWTLVTATGLAQRGHQICVIGRKNSDLINRATAEHLVTDSIPVGMDYAPVSIVAMKRVILKRGLEVLVVHHNKDVRTGGVAARILRRKVVHRNGFPIISNNFRHRLTQKFVDRIITNSERIKEKYLSYGWFSESAFDVVPNGIILPDQPAPDKMVWKKWLPVQADDLVAVFAGRLTTVKRVDDLIEAWLKLPARSRWKLIVIGRGHLDEHLQGRLESEQLTERIKLIGYQEQAGYLLGAADLVLLPSAEEGMPNALMEAMAWGVPVAASPVGDTPYLLDEGRAGWIIPVGAVQGYTDLLLHLEQHPADRIVMGNRGLERIKTHFTYQKMIDGVELCLHRALSESGTTV